MENKWNWIWTYHRPIIACGFPNKLYNYHRRGRQYQHPEINPLVHHCYPVGPRPNKLTPNRHRTPKSNSAAFIGPHTAFLHRLSGWAMFHIMEATPCVCWCWCFAGGTVILSYFGEPFFLVPGLMHHSEPQLIVILLRLLSNFEELTTLEKCSYFSRPCKVFVRSSHLPVRSQNKAKFLGERAAVDFYFTCRS